MKHKKLIKWIKQFLCRVKKGLLKNTQYDTLVIVGNGFDLSHNLKTGFDSFAESLDDNTKDKFKHYLSTYYSNYKKWSDFETNISALSESMFQESFSEQSNYKQVQADINDLNVFFEEIRLKLADYLTSQMSSSIWEHKKSVEEFLTENAFVINFNYTDTVERYTENVYYIHGSLKEKDIVLGYDSRDEACLAQYKNMRWNKTFCRERLFFKRYLRDRRHLSENDELYCKMVEDFDTVLDISSSGKGWEEEDFKCLHQPSEMKKYLSYQKTYRNDEELELPDIYYSRICTLVIMGHSIAADRKLLTMLLAKCSNLERVIIFTYGGEAAESLQRKAEFFSDKKVEIHYREF